MAVPLHPSNHFSRPGSPAPNPIAPPSAAGTARGRSQRLRRFVFTLNNYTEQELTWFTDIFPNGTTKPAWMIFGKEVGECGTPHLQGAVCLGRQLAFSTVKTWPGFRRAHLDTMRGTVDDSVRYCSKQDLNPFEFGIRPSPGKRSDLEAVIQSIRDGANMRTVAEEHPTAFIKFTKGLIALRNTRLRPRDPSHPPTVYWLHGATGVGKTRCAWEFGVNYGGPECVWLSNGGTKWFDGYDGQTVAIFDDLRSKDCSFNCLLRLLDIYPYRVEYKGGYVEWIPEVIIITCPNSPLATFATRAEHKPEDLRQLERRCTKVFDFDDDEQRLSFAELSGNADLFRRLGAMGAGVGGPSVVDVEDEELMFDSE